MDGCNGFSSLDGLKVAIYIDNNEREYCFTQKVFDLAEKGLLDKQGAECTAESRIENATDIIFSAFNGKIFDGVPVTKQMIKEYAEQEFEDRAL